MLCQVLRLTQRPDATKCAHTHCMSSNIHPLLRIWLGYDDNMLANPCRNNMWPYWKANRPHMLSSIALLSALIHHPPKPQILVTSSVRREWKITYAWWGNGSLIPQHWKNANIEVIEAMAKLLDRPWWERVWKSSWPKRSFCTAGPKASHERQVFKPDYIINARQLFIRVANHFIETTQHLEIVTARPQLPYYYESAEKPNTLIEEPSWVPNWKQPQDFQAFKII